MWDVGIGSGGHTTGEGVLVGCASMVRYFYASALAHGVMVEVDIGAFVEAVMRGLLGRWGDVVMNVCEAVQMSASLNPMAATIVRTASKATLRPAVEAWCQ
jgi:hypothetical protein